MASPPSATSHWSDCWPPPTWAGDSASMHIHVLRRGEAVRASADPYAAASAALGGLTLPSTAG